MTIKQKTKKLKSFSFYNFTLILFISLFFIFWIWKWLFITKKYFQTFNKFTNHYVRFGLNDPMYKQVEKYSLDVLNYDAELKNEWGLKIDNNLWKKMQAQEVEIYQNNISLKALLIKHNNINNNWVIGLHGWTENKWLGLRLVKHFYEAGYNIVTYDARGHGKSSSLPTSIGYYEKDDLYQVIQYLNKNYQPKNIGIIGNSMGGATILEFIKTYNKVWKHLKLRWAISDCAFSSMRLQARWMSQTIYNQHWFWTNYCTRKSMKIINNFDINKLNPSQNLVLAKNIPLLIIHGKNDQFIPLRMAKEIYNNKIKYEKTKISKISIYDSAHVQSISSDYKRYKNETLTFAKLYEK